MTLGSAIWKRGRVFVSAGALTSALVMSTVFLAPAFAEVPTPTAMTARRADGYERLEKLFQREVKVLDRQSAYLTRASNVASKVQQFIDGQNAKGKDTSKLVVALADFRSAVAEAHSEHDNAKTVLDAHAGFDAEGAVAEADEARETVRDAGKAERQFHRTLRQARRQLQNALWQYRQANRAPVSNLP